MIYKILSLRSLEIIKLIVFYPNKMWKPKDSLLTSSGQPHNNDTIIVYLIKNQRSLYKLSNIDTVFDKKNIYIFLSIPADVGKIITWLLASSVNIIKIYSI